MGSPNANKNTPGSKRGGKPSSPPSTKPGGKRVSSPGSAKMKTTAAKSTKKTAGKRKAQAGKGKQLFRRAKAGAVALREIRKLQKTTQPVLQKAPFQRIVRAKTEAHFEKMFKGSSGPPAKPRFQMRALYALQEATEAYATRLFEGAVMLQLHRKRTTLTKKDLEYVRRIRGELL
eukprot:TRINITY_DN3990_c0_g5_i1.p1 TRINITY_DN3990_c0_g5~~TRINITY_DN3990_c0_g5_i1.p1  ORF type:complete len:175 (+),score=50.89 TRINITY_DN3990_c0_g5_i1:107-631(+)